jgi:tetratricopeptide (TPR) repeat protein
LPQAVNEWAAKLKSLLTQFQSTYTPTPAEAQELQLSAAAVAIAERRFADALSIIGTPGAQPPPGPAPGGRPAAVLRARADAYYDRGDWAAALDGYREILLGQPGELSVLERLAECRLFLKNQDEALQTYGDLAKRLQDRGSRRLLELDHPAAVRDLNKAASLRLWLFEQGRRELAADLARSFTTCAAALIEVQQLELAKVYLRHAIDLHTQLITTQNRNDLAAELAGNQASYAGLLLQSSEPDTALVHFGLAIDILNHLVTQGQTALREKLATTSARRGVVRENRGQKGPAAQDFARAAETFAVLGEWREAAAWQGKALELADEASRKEAALRLDHYRAGKPYPDPSRPGQ